MLQTTNAFTVLKILKAVSACSNTENKLQVILTQEIKCA